MKHLKQLSPSVLFLISFTVSVFISWAHPWHLSFFMGDETMRLSGLVLLLASLTLNTLAYKEFKKHLTPHAPFLTPKVLIQKGVFIFSRNPVYLALVLSQCGLGFVLDTVWLLLGALILLIALNFLIVSDEEKIMQQAFKENYERYKKRTRRWL